MSKSNVEKINELMTASPAGPLMQAFIIQAVLNYAEEVLREDEPEDSPRALVSPKAWYKCAEVAYLELN